MSLYAKGPINCANLLFKSNVATARSYNPFTHILLIYVYVLSLRTDTARGMGLSLIKTLLSALKTNRIDRVR